MHFSMNAQFPPWYGVAWEVEVWHLRDGQVLIPGTYEYGVLHDRRDFADVIKTGP